MSHRMDPAEGRALLLDAAGLLDALSVPFFLIQGTALGAVRDGGFTPTERDIDLGVLAEDLPPPKAWGLLAKLAAKGCDVECFVQPLGAPHTLVAWRGSAKLDVVAFQRWKGWRYTPQPVRPWIAEPYALVHDAALLERCEYATLFDRAFRVPCPVTTYLEREYGPGWRTPCEDHVSRTRVYDFLKQEGILGTG